MPKKLICPVCAKEYVSPYFFDKHVEAHGEHEVTWEETLQPVITKLENGEIEVPEIEEMEPIDEEPEMEMSEEEIDSTREASPREL